jgi:uncharacterized low-complexity protein
MKNKKKTTVALGATVALTLAVSPVFSASTNPFQMHSLKSGYLAKAEAKTETKPESKPADAKKSTETKPAAASDKKMKHGSCGEGTCGGKK